MSRIFFALVLIITSLVVLERARFGVEVGQTSVQETPVTRYARAGSDGPKVVIAHGFAGSQQMMQGYALPLARAGYQVFVFEFLGHGRHRTPMSGDVTQVDGTTQLLVAETRAVVEAVSDGTTPVALIGHSMATDVLVRAAKTRDDIGPMVLVSAFSQEIDAATPANLLLVSGAWEPGLRAFGLKALRMVSPDASEGDTVTQGATTRRAVAAPFSEHVSVLHSRAARAEALAWLDSAYGRTSNMTILPTGWAILGLLFGLVLAFPVVARVLAQQVVQAAPVPWQRLGVILGVPAIVTPFIAVPITPGFLPVLVADYLVVHLLIFAALQLGFLRYWRVPIGKVHLRGVIVLGLWCAVFGVALDRYAANFWPTPERVWIILVMLIGAVPYMIADARLTIGASITTRIAVRVSFLTSLVIAVFLDFEDLFFILMVAPVLVLFHLVFGTMGRQAAARSGVMASGLALGGVLAWTLGVSFPLFQP